MEKNVNIAIAEDEQVIAMDIKITLQDLGYSVLNIVNSGEKLLKILENRNINIVIMDIKLKGKMDGIETAKLAFEKFNVPVIFLTALTDDELMQRAMIAQPYGYLLKPFDKKTLYSTIEMALNSHENEMKAK